MRIAGAVFPWTAGLCLLLFVAGLYFALIGSPADYQQGQTVRIMYVHVPAAWLALLVYSFIAAASAAAVIWRHPLADIAALSASPIGACFTFIALATGSLWAKPMWGAWWVWDARLTSVLILFFFYLGHMALAQAFDDPQRGRRAAAIIAIAGFINVPIVKFSVDWWNTLHQPASIFRVDGPTIDIAMRWPLGIMGMAYLLFFVTVLLMRMQAALLRARVRVLQVASLDGAPAAAQG